ncbi:hypothetical protein BBJ28_00004376 [Nothophytophthora sp. Chile5]|nr:hypothetical protein BBJ28_00004376 [Nothophytophthora sp. Chile5]
MNLEWWPSMIDPCVDERSRWHSANVGRVSSTDCVGDDLVAELREAWRRDKHGRALVEFSYELMAQLADYEAETRLLLKLAATGRVMQHIQRAMDSALSILRLRGTSANATWGQHLQEERDERMMLYESLLADEERRKSEMGDDRQQLEVLTLLQHGLQTYSDLLLPREVAAMTAVYDAVVWQSGIVTVGKLPTWFSTSASDWTVARKSAVPEGEGACIRQTAIWAELHHPHVRKFFGACHVGEPFVIHEVSGAVDRAGPLWERLRGCALGLQYVHDRGLVHLALSKDHLLYSLMSHAGVVSGLGLVHLDEASDDATEPSIAADVLAFGLVIFETLVKKRKPRGTKISSFLSKNRRQLTDVRPEFVEPAEWELLMVMCSLDPGERPKMADIVHRIGVLAQQEASLLTTTQEVATSSPTTVDDVSQYELHLLGLTLEQTLSKAEQLSIEREDYVEVIRPVYSRLRDVYEQLLLSYEPVLASLVERFSLIVLHFFKQLDRRSLGRDNLVASMCAARTISGKNYSLHHDIDRLLVTTPSLESSAEAHQWQPTWEQARQRQDQAMQTCLEDPSALLSQLPSATDQEEALALLQFEARNHADFVLDPKRTRVLPLWFIPSHQVEIGKHLADGSFGAVYLGNWLGTAVVVKQLLSDQLDRESRDQFRHEADLWFTLNHENLIKLYGACHEGRPFFVCEQATRGTIVPYLSRKKRPDAWFALWEAAKGLQYLHNHGIVHSDLKGNNILVCGDNYSSTVKLADFGLSVAASSSAKGEGALGAFRWKAPECLQGEAPTFASDIYSFGMCLIEALTGEFPWGGRMPDPAVKFWVVRRKQLPPRPGNFNDDEWDLVERMCCYDPKDRMSAGAVVSVIYRLFES